MNRSNRQRFSKPRDRRVCLMLILTRVLKIFREFFQNSFNTYWILNSKGVEKIDNEERFHENSFMKFGKG